jgi:hypothetical protein
MSELNSNKRVGVTRLLHTWKATYMRTFEMFKG